MSGVEVMVDRDLPKVDLVEPSDPDVSSSERGSMAEGDAGDAPRLGSLAQRVLEESRWIPDEEERAILVRAIQRLRQKVASESVAERQKQFQKLASQAALQIKPRGEAATPPVVERRSQGRPAAAEQSPFRPSNVETNLAEYRLRKGEEVESPPSPRRRGILRTSSITPPAINVSEVTEAMTQLPIHSTTAAAAFGRFHFKGADAGDSTPTSPSSPSSPIAKKAPLRLPVKQRASAVSIADEEDVIECDPSMPRKLSKSSSISESSTTAVSPRPSSSTVARSSVFLKSPRHSLGNLLRWKRSEVSMGDRQRSDLELGHLVGHLLLDAQRRGSLPQVLRGKAPEAPAEEHKPDDFCLVSDPSLATPQPERTPILSSGQDLGEDTQPTTPATPPTDEVAATTPSEDEQRYRDWMDGCWRAVREENDAKILQLQESIKESLQMFDEKMSALAQQVTEAPELRPEKPEETDVSLTSNVRGLQVQMERLEEVQSDLLQQLRKAEGRFRSSLEKQVTLHQETLEEHCRDLREQLKGPTPAQLQASNARPNEKLEEMLARLSLQQDQLEAEMAQMKSRQEQSQRSWEDRFREAQQSTEETSLEVLRMAELGQRMSEGMETAREEFGEQIRVLRERSDTKLASLEESFRNQLDMSMGELKKTMSAGASELRALEELTTRMSQGLETSREEVWKQIRALRDASGAKLTSFEEAQEAWQSQLDDSISELSQKLATFSESASKFDQLETRLGNFEDCMETRRAAHQRETHRLFTELQTSFDKLEGTQKTMLSDTLPEVASALIEPWRKEFIELKDQCAQNARHWADQDSLLGGEIKSLSLAQEAHADGLKALKDQLQREFHDSITAETDAVLNAVTGKISQEQQERVTSITAVRSDLKELRDLMQPTQRERQIFEQSLDWRMPMGGPTANSVSPARLARSPFAVNGGVGVENTQKRKDLCRRKLTSSTGPGHVRTPR